MVLVSLRQLLDHAAEHDDGLPAFNVNNLEQVQATCRRPTNATAR
jgi:fructose-bisphosphate aldolase, class II